MKALCIKPRHPEARDREKERERTPNACVADRCDMDRDMDRDGRFQPTHTTSGAIAVRSAELRSNPRLIGPCRGQRSRWRPADASNVPIQSSTVNENDQLLKENTWKAVHDGRTYTMHCPWYDFDTDWQRNILLFSCEMFFKPTQANQVFLFK